MMNRKLLPTAALLLSALALCLPAASGMGPAPQAMDTTRARAGHWPPLPANIVNLSSVGSGAPTTLQAQQLWSAYGVPADATLVITNARFEGTDITLGVGPNFKRRGTTGGTATLSGPGPDPGAPLGWTFPGGTQVIFRNEGLGSLPFEYELVGYLVRG